MWCRTVPPLYTLDSTNKKKVYFGLWDWLFIISIGKFWLSTLTLHFWQVFPIFFFNCTLTLDVALLHTVKNLYNQNTKVKIGYLFLFFFIGYLISAVCCIQTPTILLPGISCQFRQMHQWGYSLTGSPGEASLKSNTSTMPGRHFFTFSKSFLFCW